MRRGLLMIHFEEELKKFQPSLEVDEAEKSMYAAEGMDLQEVLESMMKYLKEKNKGSE